SCMFPDGPRRKQCDRAVCERALGIRPKRRGRRWVPTHHVLKSKDKGSMPELQVSVVLLYYLRLAEGDYQTAQVGEVVRAAAPVGGTSFDSPISFDAPIPFDGTPRTPTHPRFTPEASADPDEIRRRRARCTEQLLRRINRLLRWYRSVSRRADITELTRAQVSPFKFEASGPAPAAEWTEPLEYESAGPQPASLT